MGIENIKGPKSKKKFTKANTTLKDKLKNIKDKKSSSFTETEDDIPQRMSREPDMSPIFKNDDIKKVPGGYSKEGVGRISEKGLKGRSIQQVFDEKEKRMDNIKNTGMKKKLKSGGRVNLRGGGCAKRGVKKNAYGKNS